MPIIKIASYVAMVIILEVTLGRGQQIICIFKA